jgi:hypothetical protein
MTINSLGKLAIAIAIIGAASFRISTPAHSAVLYDNLIYASMGSDPADPAVFGPLYNSFSTGTGGFSLSRIGLLIKSSDSDGGSFTVNVLSGLNFPDSTVFLAGTFLDSQLGSALSTFNVNFSPVSLAANTRYWVELSTTGSVQWAYEGDGAGTGVNGEFFQNQNGNFDNSNGPYQMQVSDSTVSSVPETATWVMMILGFAGLASAVRFKTRSSGKPELVSSARL